MTRSSTRQAAEPLQSKPPVTRTHRKQEPPKSVQTTSKKSSDLKTSIVTNWELTSNDINACIPPEHWPLGEADPEQWPVDIVSLLHQASEFSKGNNELFQQQLSAEINLRKKRNRSAKGKTNCVTAPDLKKVCKRLEDIAQESKEAEEKTPLQQSDTKPARRGRSDGAPQDIQPKKTRAAKNTQGAKDERPVVLKGKNKPKEPNRIDNPRPKPPKRTASDLPLRPARKPRTVKSPKAKPTLPPPVTPANAPEASDEEEEEQENAPPEPVSGRHLYGDYIPPVTVDFNPSDTTAAQPKTRQTRSRKRARAEEEGKEEEKPIEVQVDSDPRDIDATGFLSELDPKEARRRRKPRLSRLQAEPVGEPAWSQDLPSPAHVLEPELVFGTGPAEVPIPMAPDFLWVTPTANGLVASNQLKSPAEPTQSVRGAADEVGEEWDKDEHGEQVDGEDVLADVLADMLEEWLPRIPEHATDEERSILEDRMVLLRRDATAYQRSVWDIEKRVGRKTRG